jgi:hypothetical protein
MGDINPHQVTVLRRSIDDEEVAVLHCSNHLVEIGELGGLVFVNLGAFGASNAAMDRQLEIGMGPLGPGTAAQSRNALWRAGLHRIEREQDRRASTQL